MASLEDCKKLLGGISPGASFLLSLLIQSPSFSLSPFFNAFLLGGAVFLAISLGRFFEKKHKWLRSVWHVAGISLSGFVLVSWARYHSAVAGVVVYVLVVAAIVMLLQFMGKKIAIRYGKAKRLVYLGMVFCALFPSTVIFQHIGERPTLVVSPSTKYVRLPAPGTEAKLNVSIVSVYANTWNVQLTAKSPELLSVYLDSRQQGPFEIQFLERGREELLILRIQASPQIPKGIQRVSLDFRYRDSFGSIYEGSTDIEVSIGIPIRPCVVATATFESEMSTEVAFLRCFRDNNTKTTFAGHSFMEIFETFYYSFSPSVAYLVSESSGLKILTRFLIYPLMESLYLSSFVFNAFSFAPELAIVVTGITAAALLGVVYAFPISALVLARTIIERKDHLKRS